MNYIQLKPHRDSGGCGYVSDDPWTESLPFVTNKRGKLCHRIKHGADYYYGDEFHHVAVSYWCNGQANGQLVDDEGRGNLDLHDVVPDGMLVCARCEAMLAVYSSEKGTDEMCGKHVHRGRMVPQQTCCGGGE